MTEAEPKTYRVRLWKTGDNYMWEGKKSPTVQLKGVTRTGHSSGLFLAHKDGIDYLYGVSLYTRIEIEEE